MYGLITDCCSLPVILSSALQWCHTVAVRYVILKLYQNFHMGFPPIQNSFDSDLLKIFYYIYCHIGIGPLLRY